MNSASTLKFNVEKDEGLPSTPISTRLDGFVIKVSELFSWFWAAVIVVIAITIFVRYGAAKLDIQSNSYLLTRLLSSVFWEELTWYLFGWVWLVGISYVIVVDEHVRVDLFHERLSKSKQVWIEILGIMFMLLPLFLVIVLHGLDFGLSSFRDSEGSQQVGLDFVWIIKFSIPLAVAVILIASVSRLIKCFEWMRLKTGTRLSPKLLLVQVIAALYLAFIIYLMHSWSQDMEPMTIFQIFGL